MPPTLEGKRVRLRPLRMDDLAFCLAFANDEDLRPRLRFWRPLDEEGERAWLAGVLAREGAFWAIVPQGAADAPVGLLSLDPVEPVAAHAELGIAIRGREHRGKGFGEEAARLALAYAFGEMGLHRVHLRVYDGNPARSLYERLGFRHEGTLRRDAFKGGAAVDTHLYGLLREEWSP